MNKTLKRTLSGLTVGAGVVALFLYCPLPLLPPLALVLSTLAQAEFYQMAKAYQPVSWFGLLMGLVWLLFIAAFPGGAMIAVYGFPGFFLAFLTLSLIILFDARYVRPLGSLAVTLAGFFYVPFLFSFFVQIVQVGAPMTLFAMPSSREGLYTLLFLIAVAKFSDTGGFALGLAFGRHKMCPTISPNKSWEGLVGSILFAAVTACVFLAFARHFQWGTVLPVWTKMTYPLMMSVGAVLALIATAGDLLESRLKRECGVKDSATFMPAGMGGFLDMFDSVLFLPALAFLIEQGLWR